MIFLAGANEIKRDFIKENTKQIKTIQKSNRESESALSAREPLKVLHKSAKYEHVESKVAQEVKVDYRYSMGHALNINW